MRKRLLAFVLSGLMCFSSVLPAMAENLETPVVEMQTEGLQEEQASGEEYAITADLRDYILQEGGLSLYVSDDISGDEIELLSESEELAIDNVSSDKEEIEEYIYQAILNKQTSINVYSAGYRIPSGDSSWAYIMDVINAHPELFHVSVGTAYSTGGYVSRYTVSYSDNYDLDKFEEETNKALAVVKPGMSDLEKAIAIHEYLVLDCEYDIARYYAGTLSQHPDTYNAYGVLVDKQAVCNGYALAYMYLMNRLGVHTVIVSSRTVNHAWNMINLDGYWYEVDCTWDDPIWDYYGMVRHKNMICSDAVFPSKHIASDWVIRDNGVVVTDIAATDTKYDNAFWLTAATVSQLINHEGYYYYSTYSSSRNSIKKVAISDYNGTSISDLNVSIPTWKVWNGGGYYYTTSYSSFEECNGRLLYSTPTTINSINFDGTDNKVVYTLPTGTEGYIYGAHIKDNQMYVVIDTEAKRDEIRTKTPVELTGIKLNSERKVTDVSLDLTYPGVIRMLFYIENLDETEIISINGTGYSVSSSNKNNGVHVFAYEIPAKEIYKDIEVKAVTIANTQKVLKLANKENTIDGVFYYSVSDYLYEVINNPAKYDTKLVNLCESLLIYGDNANGYFGGTPSTMKSKVSFYTNSKGKDPLADYDMKFAGDESLKSRLLGGSLVLDGRIAVKLYYKDDSAAGYGVRYYSGLGAEQLNTTFMSSFDNGAYQILYGPFTYMKKVRDKNNNPELIQLLEALYGYWYYSNVYFDSKFSG